MGEVDCESLVWKKCQLILQKSDKLNHKNKLKFHKDTLQHAISWILWQMKRCAPTDEDFHIYVGGKS